MNGPRVRGWLDPRGRHAGTWAFIAGRLTGLLLTGYLYLHLAALTLLTRGPGAWNRFIDIAGHPVFLGIDILLIAGLLVHALHGVRVALLGSGLLADARRTLMIVLTIAGVLIGLTATLLLVT